MVISSCSYHYIVIHMIISLYDYIVLSLHPSIVNLSLRYEVDLAEDVLAVTLHVTNPGDQAFDFQVSQSKSET